MMPIRLLLPLLLALLVSACERPAAESPFPTTLAAVEQATVTVPPLPIQHWETAEGVPVLFVRRSEIPMVDLLIGFDAGSSRDGEQPGLAAFAADLYNEGTSQLSLEDIVNGFDSQGAHFAVRSSTDLSTVSLRSLSDSDYLEPTLALFLDVLTDPVYPEPAIERHRHRVALQFQREQQTPQTPLSDRYRALVYGNDHPYAQRRYGTLATLPTITSDTLRTFQRSHYTRASAVIALVGDLTLDQAQALAQRISSHLPPGDTRPAPPRVEPRQAALHDFIPFPSEQTWFAIGNQAIWRGHPDWPALYLANEVLGGAGFGSLLMEEVREKRGYVYGISSQFSRLLSAGPFTIQFQTRADNAQDALQVTLDVLRRFIQEGVSEQRLRETVTATLNQFILANTDNASLAQTLLAYGYYRLPLDYQEQFIRQLQQLTPEDLRTAFARHVNPEHLIVVAAGRQSPFSASPPTAEEQP